MTRLRIRIALNKGRVGVPLRKLASVAAEAGTFFRMLCEDVGIEPEAGDWLATDFIDNSLEFTAEFVGRVTASQIRDFYAALDGLVPIRAATATLFTRIADVLDRDESITFGFYTDGERDEPTEWRSFTQQASFEILDSLSLASAAAVGGVGTQSRITLNPAIWSYTGGKPREREHRAGDGRTADSRLTEAFVHTIRTDVMDRLSTLEHRLADQDGEIRVLREKLAKSEQSLKKILEAAEKLFHRVPESLPASPAAEAPAFAATAASAEAKPGSWRVWTQRVLLSALIWLMLVAAMVVGFRLVANLRTSPPPSSQVRTETPAPPPPKVEAPKPTPAPPPVPTPARIRVRLRAHEDSWLTVLSGDQKGLARMLSANQEKILEGAEKIEIRLGNAGGVEADIDGKSLGRLGRSGQVRVIEFAAGGYRVVSSR